MFCFKKISFFLFFSILVFNFKSSANDKISVVTSTTHYASLLSMITDEGVDVRTIQKKCSCPHHMTIKPSEAELIEKADLVIYIDDFFDNCVSKFKNKTNAQFIKISSFDDIIVKEGNFHIWLDINNSINYLSHMKDILISKGVNKDRIEEKFVVAVSKLKNLQKLWNEESKLIQKNIVIVSDSLRYIPIEDGNNFHHLYINSNISLKKASEIKDEIKKLDPICILASNSSNLKMLKNLINHEKILPINSEFFGNKDLNIADVYIHEMESMIYNIKSFCN